MSGTSAMELGELPRSPSPMASSHNSDEPLPNHIDEIKVGHNCHVKLKQNKTDWLISDIQFEREVGPGILLE